MARPEGNITGVNILALDLDGKRQELLIEAVPGLRRMAALADFNKALADVNNKALLEALHDPKHEALQEAARARNVEPSIYRVAGRRDWWSRDVARWR